jgi:intracellular multiplication protein IcmQ
MKDELSDLQTNAILQALNDAIEQGPWDESNFLRAIGKNLREIRDGFSNQVNATEINQSKMIAQFAKKTALRSGQQEIFIALYSSEGTKLQSWERILINLPKQMISRPIYADEADVRAIIRTKENKHNEAFVSMYINHSDVLQLPPDKIPRDKLGKPLLTLKDKSLALDNIHQFVSAMGTYQYIHGRLVKISASE